MAKLPVPAKPELYKRKNGLWIIRYPTVNILGGRSSSSFALTTNDQKEARKRFRSWMHFDWPAIKANAATAKQKLKGSVPVLVATPKPHKAAKGADHLKEARQQFRILSAQLHALALNVEKLGEALDGDG